MANNPAFSSTPAAGAGLLPATADTSQTAPANVTIVLAAGANGTQIYELCCEPVGTTVAGLVNVFLFDGTTYHLYDQVPITASTVSQVAANPRVVRTYPNLILPNGWSLRVAGTVAGNQSLVKVSALGANL